MANVTAAAPEDLTRSARNAVPATLVVRHSPNWRAEHLYILGLLFGERLGLRWESEPVAGLDWVEVRCPEIDHGTRVLQLGANFFLRPQEQRVSAAALPVVPLSSWDPVTLFPEWQFGPLPIVYQALCVPPAQLAGERVMFLPLDLLGGAFFLLTRYEELVGKGRDQHGRFPAGDSLAVQAGFILRPLVDEYTELLRCAVQRCFPGIRCRQSEPRIRLTHDIDHAFQFLGRTWPQMLISAGKALRHRSGPRHAWQLLRAGVRAGIGREAAADPFNTYDELMSASERLGTRAELYFVTRVTSRRYDEAYDLARPELQDVLRRIHRRGHVIGLHSSYNSYRSESGLRQELGALRRGAGLAGIQLDAVGGRQHYLRWDHLLGWKCREAAGLAYDATLGFPDQVGFRCGTAHEFPVFDVPTSQPLKLRERPLIAMDVTLTDYLQLSPEEVTSTLERLWSSIRRVGGIFEVLIHNCNPAALWLADRVAQLRP